MKSQRTFSGAPPAPRRRLMGLLVLWTWIVDGLAALGTVLIGILMLIICADVVARNLLGSSLPLVSELGALTLVMIVYLQLGTTVRHNRLARAELFLSRFSEHRPRAGQVLAGIYDLAGAVMCALMAWSTLRILEKDFGSHEYIGVTGVLTFPTYPFRILIMVGIAVAAMQFLVQAVAAIYAAPKPTGDN